MVISIRLQLAYSVRQHTYRSLLPFIIIAGIFGILLVFPYAAEISSIYKMGDKNEMEAMSFRFNGPYWWVYSSGFILPLLPAFGLFPAIGKRPILVVAIAVIAMIPVSYTPVVSIITQLTSGVD
jgi:hypothetical protein